MTLNTGTGVAKALMGNSIVRKLLLVCAALIVALPASAGVRFVGGGFGYAPWGFGYDPYYYGGYPMAAHPNAGEIRLDTKVKDAEVYVNGAFAGAARDLKSMWLQQGTYNLEVRSPGRAPFKAQVYVVNGKTMHVRPELRVEPKS